MAEDLAVAAGSPRDEQVPLPIEVSKVSRVQGPLESIAQRELLARAGISEHDTGTAIDDLAAFADREGATPQGSAYRAMPVRERLRRQHSDPAARFSLPIHQVKSGAAAGDVLVDPCKQLRIERVSGVREPGQLWQECRLDPQPPPVFENLGHGGNGCYSCGGELRVIGAIGRAAFHQHDGCPGMKAAVQDGQTVNVRQGQAQERSVRIPQRECLRDLIRAGAQARERQPHRLRAASRRGCRQDQPKSGMRRLIGAFTAAQQPISVHQPGLLIPGCDVNRRSISAAQNELRPVSIEQCLGTRLMNSHWREKHGLLRFQRSEITHNAGGIIVREQHDQRSPRATQLLRRVLHLQVQSRICQDGARIVVDDSRRVLPRAEILPERCVGTH